MTMCADGVNHDARSTPHCRVKPHMGIVGDAVRGALEAVRWRSSVLLRRQGPDAPRSGAFGAGLDSSLRRGTLMNEALTNREAREATRQGL